MQTSIVILAVVILVGFVAYLGLLAFVVIRTGDTRGLRDVAAAVRAYRGVLAIVTRTPASQDVAARESETVDALSTSNDDPSPDP